jgi:ABC-type dipeptide/oligopeptide/nickel transport system permease component
MKVLKAFLGATLGLVLGVVLGSMAAMWQVTLRDPSHLSGQVAVMGLRFPIFWAVLLLNIVGFAFLFSRIGHAVQHARM